MRTPSATRLKPAERGCGDDNGPGKMGGESVIRSYVSHHKHTGLSSSIKKSSTRNGFGVAIKAVTIVAMNLIPGRSAPIAALAASLCAATTDAAHAQIVT